MIGVSRGFQSYLSDRQQLVDVSGTLSSHANISCGVPQGSILGPLLFLIYVNDMSGAVCNKLLLYADDSAIVVQSLKYLKIGTCPASQIILTYMDKILIHIGNHPKFHLPCSLRHS